MAVKDSTSSTYIGFLPFITTKQVKFGIRVYSILTLGLRPMPVYTDYICLPECTTQVATSISGFLISEMKWDKLFIPNFINQRIDLLVSQFSTKIFTASKTNALPGLMLKLPESYEKYLKDYFGGDSRRLMQRTIRRIENEPNAHLTYVTADTLERDIDILLDFWQKRWGKKYESAYEKEILTRLFHEDLIWLYVLWYGDKPMAALSFFLDKPKKIVYGHLTGYDMEYKKLSPGTALFLFGIQQAIEEGYSTFDFAQGLDNYKLMFRAEKRDVFRYRVSRKSIKSTLLKGLGLIKT